MHRTQRGMTLLEIVMATSIFALIVSLCFSVSIFSARSFNESISFSYLQTKGERALKNMTEEVCDAYALDPTFVIEDGSYFYGAQINYRVPITYGQPNLVKPGASYHVVSPAGLPVFSESVANPTMPGDFYLTLDFGWRDDRFSVQNSDTNTSVPLQGPGLRTSGAPSDVTIVNSLTPNGHMSFRFVKNRNADMGINGIYDEAAQGVDIDNDGLLTSRYVVGYLERCIWLDNDRNAATGQLGDESLMSSSRMALADSNVLLPIGGTATGDPENMKTTRLFVKSGSRVDVTIWLASLGESRIPRVVKCSTSVFLRNN